MRAGRKRYASERHHGAARSLRLGGRGAKRHPPRGGGHSQGPGRPRVRRYDGQPLRIPQGHRQRAAAHPAGGAHGRGRLHRPLCRGGRPAAHRLRRRDRSPVRRLQARDRGRGSRAGRDRREGHPPDERGGPKEGAGLCAHLHRYRRKGQGRGRAPLPARQLRDV